MRKLTFTVACCVFSAMLLRDPVEASLGAQSSDALTAPYETRDPGQRQYVRQGCYQCHGLVGQGSILSGPSLAPLRIDSDAFRRYVRNPKGAMPPYTKRVLADADLDSIEAFIRSLPPGRPYKTIPALARVGSSSDHAAEPQLSPSGRAIYQRHCAACHGESREGGIAPSLIGAGRKRDVAAIAALLANPPRGMPKLSPQPLTNKDVEAVARFVADVR